MFVRLLLGLVKGVAIGGGVGYGAYAAGLGGGWNWLTYGLIGAIVGLLVGKPIWKHIAQRGSTAWTPVLKGLVGYGVAVGLYALAAKVWGGMNVHLGDIHGNVVQIPFLLGGAIGGLYGAFVEVDDADAVDEDSKPAS